MYPSRLGVDVGFGPVETGAVAAAVSGVGTDAGAGDAASDAAGVVFSGVADDIVPELAAVSSTAAVSGSSPPQNC